MTNFLVSLSAITTHLLSRQIKTFVRTVFVAAYTDLTEHQHYLPPVGWLVDLALLAYLKCCSQFCLFFFPGKGRMSSILAHVFWCATQHVVFAASSSFLNIIFGLIVCKSFRFGPSTAIFSTTGVLTPINKKYIFWGAIF